MVERFVDVFKRTIKQGGIETMNKELQKFLSIYCITPNINVNSGMALAKLQFARKICSVFERLRPTEKKIVERKKYQW